MTCRLAHLDFLRSVFAALRARPPTPETLARLQAGRLRRLLEYAGRYSPYYRELFRGLRIRPADIRGADDLARIPVLERPVARERWRDILSTEYPPGTCPQRSTHGTTGTPLAVPTLPIEQWLDAVLWACAYTDAGCRPWHRQAKISLPSRMPARPRLLQRLGLFRRVHLEATQPAGDKIRALRAARPRSLVCWASTLDEVATELERTDAYLDIPRVFTTSSMLWPSVRERALHRLKARVTDMYGAIETGPIAWECERHQGFHVHSDLVIVELLDEAGRPARTGRVVCTVLWRRAFPLIRYALGDTAEWAGSPCPCGRPYPLLRSLTGRATELVELPDGTRMSTVALRAAVFGKPGIEQFQMVQETATRFVLRLVVRDAFTPDIERGLLDEFHRQFAGVLELRIERVPDLRGPPGVKFAPVVLLK